MNHLINYKLFENIDDIKYHMQNIKDLFQYLIDDFSMDESFVPDEYIKMRDEYTIYFSEIYFYGGNYSELSGIFYSMSYIDQYDRETFFPDLKNIQRSQGEKHTMDFGQHNEKMFLSDIEMFDVPAIYINVYFKDWHDESFMSEDYTSTNFHLEAIPFYDELVSFKKGLENIGYTVEYPILNKKYCNENYLGLPIIIKIELPKIN